jgi:DNA-binding MarR family transcriptional regulator
MKLSNVLKGFAQLNNHHITGTTLAVFLHIGETDAEICQSDIVNHFGIQKSTVSRIINVLSSVETKEGEKIQLVERKLPRSGPSRNVLVLTCKGQELFDQMYSDFN